MAFAPDGALYLLRGIPFTNSYENTVDFTNATEQYNYFIGKVAETLVQYTYIRKDQTVKIGLNVEMLHSLNYVMYRNAIGTKWIYAFITAKHYINDNNTEIEIETDVLQTYAYDYDLKDSFVDREHQDRWAAVGSPSYNLVSENLTLGDEYIKEHSQEVIDEAIYYLVVSTENLDAVADDPRPASVYDDPVPVQDYPTPFHYYIVPRDEDTTAGIMGIQRFCQTLAGRLEIVSVSLIKYITFYLPVLDTISIASGDPRIYVLRNKTAAVTTVGFTKNKFDGVNLPTSFGTGRARDHKYESKLLTHPYLYNVLTEHQGDPLILKNEYLTGNDIQFSVTQGLSHQIKTRKFVSSGYLGEIDGKEQGALDTKVNDLPQLNYEYLNYMLTQKAQATTGIALSVIGATAGIAVGAATGGLGLALGAGNALSAAGTIAHELAKQKDLKNTPDSVRSQGNNVTFDLAEGTTALNFIRYGIHPNIKRVIGDYFGMYGYKCMEVKRPALRSRYYYNYIKTIGANVAGDMDVNDLNKIRGIFDQGVTFWHNRAGVTPLSYQYDNVEMNLI